MDDEYECYFVQVYFDERYGNTLSFLTHWVGFADQQNRVELRAASKTSLKRLRSHWRIIANTELEYIREDVDLWKLFIMGGAAAIDAGLAEQLIPEHLAPKCTASVGIGPFRSVEASMKQATQRAPSKKLRMQILERDHYRCRICGQSSKTNVNIELHVHHIRPWESLGATVENNLVTLCHTCHGGLVPHWNMTLAHYVVDIEGDLNRWKMPPISEIGN